MEEKENKWIFKSALLEYNNSSAHSESEHNQIVQSYLNLSTDQKILAETQEQTRKINKIYANVKFWFWLTILSIVSYIYILWKSGATLNNL